MKRLTTFLNTPAGTVIAMGLIVLLGEFSIMLLIEGVDSILKDRISDIFWEFFDPIVLALIVSPALYFLIFRPMRNQQAELEQKNVELRGKDQLSALIEVIPDTVLFKDGESRWQIVNEPARKMFKLHHLPWQGKTEMELAALQPEFRAAYEGCRSTDENAWQAGRLLVAEESFAGEDGRCVILETRKVPMFDEAGRRKGLVVIGRDITERKRIDEKLQESYERFRQLSENIREVFWMTDPAKGEMLYISPAYETIWGKTVESLYASPQDWLNAIHVEDRQRVLQAAMSKQVAGLYDEEYRIIRPDGGVRWIHDQAFPVRDGDGQVYRVVGVAEDITVRKASDARIDRLTKLYRALSEVNQAIVRMDDKSALFPLLCRTAVEFGGLEMAWIGQLNVVNGLIEPVVSFGNGVEYLDGLVISSKQDVPEGRGPAGIAFRENRTVIVNDFQANDITAPWHELALHYGWGAGGFFPIPRAGAPFAVFAVYHAHVGAFDAEMIGLLSEISSDISFALDSFDRERERNQAQEALLSGERHFRAYFERSRVGMAATSPEKGWLEVNDALCEMLGYSREELMRMTWAALTHPDDLEENLREYNRIIDGEIESYTIENRFIRKDGKVVYARRTPQAVRKADGSLDYIVALVEDITGRKLAEQELRIAATAFETEEGIMITDLDQRILRVNRAFTRLTGFSATDAIGRTPALLHSGRQNAEFYRNLWDSVTRDKYWQGEVWNRRKNGEVYPEWLTITAVADANGQVAHYVGIFSDISLRKASDEKIHQLAFYDTVTGLPNRSLLQDRLFQTINQARRHSGKAAVLFLDLDNFKVLNDSLGHQYGDMLLKGVASRLVENLREEDTVARQGGDEFVVILPEMGREEDVTLIVDKLLEMLSASFECNGHQIFISASVGIAVYPRDGEDEAALFRNAESAMYRAKDQGKNRFQFFTPEMNEFAMERHAIENGFRRALEQGEFVLHYQPQVDLQSGQIFSVEALVRWQHPEMGLIAPSRFIPVAEETGLIVQLGKWVMQTACLQIKAWHDIGFDIGVAVNLSIRQFRDNELVETVKEALKISGIEARHLELELTESILIQDTEQVLSLLRELKTLGVQLSIDDFGTGYSSLGYLKRLPLDRIKIDQSFVRDIITDPEDMVIVEAIISMAHSLRLRVIAEGVETLEQQMFLHARKCDEIQGYYFSRPLPGSDITALLQSGRKLEYLGGDEGKQTLLLLDDEENILNALVRLLRRDGYRILKTTSAHEALAMLATHSVGVIISDQRMPEMSGVDFLRRAKQLHPNSIRIVLSGYTDLNSVTEAINEGAVYKFLTKPWEDDLLRANISEAFQRYEMRRDLDRTVAELASANQELSRAKQMLEKRVDEKTLEALRNMDILKVSQEVLECLPVGVLGVDEDGMVVLANRTAQQVFGSGLFGSWVSERLPAVLYDCIRKAFENGQCNIPGFQMPGGGIADCWCHSLGASSQAKGVVLVFAPEVARS
jgi:diguanylate cyclase (GGDEF)-like protein/PAS domain S-box-containing protein